MAKYPFLSDTWIEAARGVYDAHRSEAPRVAVTLRANLIITDVPFQSEPIHAHLDTSSGELEIELGHLDPADVTLTLEYSTAKAQIVNQDQAAVVQAFMAGRIKIDGDMMKVMALAAGGIADDGDSLARRVAADLEAITE